MVRVREGVVHDVPCTFPAELLFVNKDAKEFDNRDSWMRVVQLDRVLAGEIIPVVVLLFEHLDQITNSRSAEKVLLLEPELLSRIRRIIRVEHRGDIFSPLPRLDGAEIITLIELSKFEFIGRLSLPQSQVVAIEGVVSWHRHVIGHGNDDFAAVPVGSF